MRTYRLTTAAAATLAACLLAPHIALAQPGQRSQPPPPPDYNGGYGQPTNGGGGYYATQPPSRFHYRRGLTLGFGVGVGGMTADSGPIDCFNCDYSPVAGGLDFHIGGMLNPRLALVFEVWGTGQALDADGTEVLFQTMFMGAVQYWLTRQLWLKGGIGASSLTVSFDDGFSQGSDQIDTGTAIMGAVGFELASTPRFAVDGQLRLGSGNYNGISDRIHSVSLGVGVNWY